MKTSCFIGAILLSLSTAQAQGTVSAKSVAVRINTLPLFEAKTPGRTANPEAAKGRIIWRETFVDNQHGWKTVKTKTGTFTLVPGGYQIQTEKKEIDAASLVTTPIDLNGSDFTLESTIESTGDNPPSAGIMVGGEVDQYYVLQINNFSKFTVQYVQDKKPINPEDFVFNQFIDKNINKLKITKTGGIIDFFINGEKIQTRRVQPLAGQQIGLIGAGRNATFKHVLLIGSSK
ncbi:hypothetical protein [Spirosoma jeollabukense]